LGFLIVVNMVLAVTVVVTAWFACATGECNIKVLSECEDLCDPGLSSNFVQAVLFNGPLADFGCLPSNVQVHHVSHVTIIKPEYFRHLFHVCKYI
jgi:hypothetical protein